jgi:hypothetical protein
MAEPENMIIVRGRSSRMSPFYTQCLSSGLPLSKYPWSICSECAEDFSHSSFIIYSTLALVFLSVV